MGVFISAKQSANRSQWHQPLRLAFAVVALCFAAFVRAQTTVIVNDSVNAEAISRQSLQAIFTMSRQHWDDRQAIKVVVLPARDAAHTRFVRNVLDIYPYQLKKSWDRLIFSGRGLPPQQAANEQDMLKLVATQPGAIGYVSDPALADNYRGLKVVESR